MVGAKDISFWEPNGPNPWDPGIFAARIPEITDLKRIASRRSAHKPADFLGDICPVTLNDALRWGI